MEVLAMIEREVAHVETTLAGFRNEGKQVFVSSSFQSHSIPLLHIIATIDKTIPVYFLNTGFHFTETLEYRDQIQSLLDVEVHNLYSPVTKLQQMDRSGQFAFCNNTDYCCHINKVLPLEPILTKNDIWITGVRRDQSSQRKAMKPLMGGPFGVKRYHPMLNWTSKMIWEYRKMYDLPSHPLEAKGYYSVGCAPCTLSQQDEDRNGRWYGQKKEECGLHTTLLTK